MWYILTQAMDGLKIFTFMGYFSRKYFKFELKTIE